jgi:hypothetical protein
MLPLPFCAFEAEYMSVDLPSSFGSFLAHTLTSLLGFFIEHNISFTIFC